MAEFQAVMKQAKRMCNEIGDCDECPLCNVFAAFDCPFAQGGVDVRTIENVVMQWAAKNPEPRYPTWAEWQKANFPDARHSICPNYFMAKKPLGTCAAPCARCTNTPIPADIAEKLGIKPMGGLSDEDA